MAKRIGLTLVALLGLALGLGYFTGMIGTERASADVEWQMANGVNIPGNDIFSYALSVPDPGYCRQACDQNAQCVGYTFVKPGVQGPNAMCWLKGSLSQGVRDANTISGIKPNAGGPAPGGSRVETTMSLGYNLPGSDIASLALPRGDPTLCQQACDGNGQCVAWTFVKPGVQGSNAMCWLKGGVPVPQADDNVISGLRLAARPAVGGGGGGVGAGGGGSTDWGVWASASGGNWSDPCAIQYNAAQILGNRYDGNPGYARVRTRATQPEADLDIDHFGRYNRDQPDGVIKMVPCDEDTVIAGGAAGGAGAGGATGNFAGTFTNSGLGSTITISGGGGSWTAVEEWARDGRNGTNNWSGCVASGNTLNCNWTGQYRGDPDKTGDRRGTLTASINGNTLTGSYYENEPTFHWNVEPYPSAMHEGAVWPINHAR